jgi:hypothetical protein
VTECGGVGVQRTADVAVEQQVGPEEVIGCGVPCVKSMSMPPSEWRRVRWRARPCDPMPRNRCLLESCVNTLLAWKEGAVTSGRIVGRGAAMAGEATSAWLAWLAYSITAKAAAGQRDWGDARTSG